MTEEKPKQDDSQKDDFQETKKGFFEKAGEKMEDGVKAAGETVSGMADDLKDKASRFTDSLLTKLKKSTQDVLDASTKFLDSLSEKAQQYQEKYKDRVEIIRMKREQEKIFSQLGKAFYDKKQATDISAQDIIKDAEFTDFVNRIDEISKKIVEQGEQIDQKENK